MLFLSNEMNFKSKIIIVRVYFTARANEPYADYERPTTQEDSFYHIVSYRPKITQQKSIPCVQQNNFFFKTSKITVKRLLHRFTLHFIIAIQLCRYFIKNQ